MRGSFPRGIPAASLKRVLRCHSDPSDASFPRGIPAASLKHARVWSERLEGTKFSAGNTRGLIEAVGPYTLTCAVSAVFRGEYPRPH